MAKMQPNLDKLRALAERYADGVTGGGAAYAALGRFVDAAGLAGDESSLLRALKLADQVQARVGPKVACLVNYARANAWASLRASRTSEANAWDWGRRPCAISVTP